MQFLRRTDAEIAASGHSDIGRAFGDKANPLSTIGSDEYRHDHSFVRPEPPTVKLITFFLPAVSLPLFWRLDQVPSPGKQANGAAYSGGSWLPRRWPCFARDKGF